MLKFPVNKSLITLKFALFLSAGGFASYLSFATLHILQFGVTMDQIAISEAILPVTAAIGSQITGMVADRIGNYKICVIVLTIISMTTATFYGSMGAFVVFLIPSNSTDSYNHEMNNTVGDSSIAATDTGNVAVFLILLFRSLGSFTAASTFSLLDSITISMATEHKAEIGKQKLWATLGHGTFPIISGAVIDWLQNLNGYRSYAAGFYLSTILLLLSLIPLALLDIKPNDPSRKVLKEIVALLRQPKIALFVSVAGLLGFSFRYTVTYDFLFLDSMGAPNYLQGLTVTVSCISGIICLQISGIILDKLGPERTLLLTLLTFTLRFYGYSFIRDPWLALIINAFEGLAFPLGLVCCSRFCALNVPAALTASLMGTMQMAVQSLGGISGSVGGIMISKYGYQTTMMSFGAVVGAGAFFYGMMHQFYLNRLPEKSVLKVEAAGHVNPSLEIVEELSRKERPENDEKTKENPDVEITHF